MESNRKNQNNVVNEEISLVLLLNIILKERLFVLFLTFAITSASVIYAYSLTPFYKSYSSFTSPGYESVMTINKHDYLLESKNDYLLESKNDVFSSFLNILFSKEFQKSVYMNGDFESNINNKADRSLQIVKEVSILPPRNSLNDVATKYLLEPPFVLQMYGSDPKFISRFLNELIVAANNETIKRYTKIFELKTQYQINNLLSSINELKSQDQQKRLNRINELKSEYRIASQIGVKKNNLNLLNSIEISKNTIPDWYLLGEEGILLKLKELNNDDSISSNEEITVLEARIEKIKNYTFNLSGFNAFTLVSAAGIPEYPYKPNKKRIVILSFLSSLLLSIMLILSKELLLKGLGFSSKRK